MPKSPTSGLRFHIRVEMDDGEQLDLQTTLTDVLRWEKANGGRPFMVVPLPLERQLWLMWVAARRLGLTNSKDAEGWAAKVADYEVVDDEDDDGEQTVELDPTKPAPSAA